MRTVGLALTSIGVVRLNPSAVFDNVPPGVYYARVRALNEIGPSPASSDVQVVVR